MKHAIFIVVTAYLLLSCSVSKDVMKTSLENYAAKQNTILQKDTLNDTIKALTIIHRDTATNLHKIYTTIIRNKIEKHYIDSCKRDTLICYQPTEKKDKRINVVILSLLIGIGVLFCVRFVCKI